MSSIIVEGWDGTSRFPVQVEFWDGQNRMATSFNAQHDVSPGGGSVGPTTVTRFGACPTSGSGEAAVTQVVTKYGGDRSKTAVRLFRGASTDPATAFAAPAKNAAIIHTSCKPGGDTTPDYAGILAGKYDGAFDAFAIAAPPNHVIEIYHEADHKKLPVADTIAIKNRFFDRVTAANPKVLVAHTLTGWSFGVKSGYDPDIWGTCRAHVIGVDCDGIHPTQLPYTAYDNQIVRAQAFVEKWADSGYRYWAVPEFGCPRIASDTGGVARAAWMKEYGDKFRAGGALYVCAYEAPSTAGNELTTPAEISAWSAEVNYQAAA